LKIDTSLLLFTLSVLSGCTSIPAKKEAPVDWKSRQAAFAQIDSWLMHARIGMRSKHHSGSATLIWDETERNRKLRLLGPLGGGVIYLQQDKTGVSLQDSNRVTGWQIPVSGLRWWLLGITEPGSTAEYTLDESQRLLSVTQDGWKVTLDKYRLFGDYELPSLIVVETQEGQDKAGYIRAKLIVKEWKITN
jgi:outer membrane lipoprotein LolB